MTISAEEVRAAVKKYNIKSWMLRRCSMCGYELRYLFKDDLVGYDTGCFCTNNFGGVRLADYHEIAEFFNMQIEEVAESMWNDFTHSGEVLV